jgi:hypothetical protein
MNPKEDQMDRQKPMTPREATPTEHDRDTDDRPMTDRTTDRDSNPPRTTTGKVTAPKFGSAGSGGAELEPGPEKD